MLDQTGVLFWVTQQILARIATSEERGKPSLTMGYSILYPYRGMDVKFQAFPESVEFDGVSP